MVLQLALVVVRRLTFPSGDVANALFGSMFRTLCPTENGLRKQRGGQLARQRAYLPRRAEKSIQRPLPLGQRRALIARAQVNAPDAVQCLDADAAPAAQLLHKRGGPGMAGQPRALLLRELNRRDGLQGGLTFRQQGDQRE